MDIEAIKRSISALLLTGALTHFLINDLQPAEKDLFEKISLNGPVSLPGN